MMKKNSFWFAVILLCKSTTVLNKQEIIKYDTETKNSIILINKQDKLS